MNRNVDQCTSLLINAHICALINRDPLPSNVCALAFTSVRKRFKYLDNQKVYMDFENVSIYISGADTICEPPMYHSRWYYNDIDAEKILGRLSDGHKVIVKNSVKQCGHYPNFWPVIRKIRYELDDYSCQECN